MGAPEQGTINAFNAHVRKEAFAPVANDPVACQRLYNETLKIFGECDPQFSPVTDDLKLEE